MSPRSWFLTFHVRGQDVDLGETFIASPIRESLECVAPSSNIRECGGIR
jgi:hypothetical protein